MKSFWGPVPQLETKKRKAFAGPFQGGFERPQPTKRGMLLLHQPSKELPSPRVRLGWRPVSHEGSFVPHLPATTARAVAKSYPLPLPALGLGARCPGGAQILHPS